MKPTCRFGHSKEKMNHHASLHHKEYCQYQKYLGVLNFQSPGFAKALQYTERPNHLQI